MSKKKILLLADDFRLPSGIGTVVKKSSLIQLKSLIGYNWDLH